MSNSGGMAPAQLIAQLQARAGSEIIGQASAAVGDRSLPIGAACWVKFRHIEGGKHSLRSKGLRCQLVRQPTRDDLASICEKKIENQSVEPFFLLNLGPVAALPEQMQLRVLDKLMKAQAVAHRDNLIVPAVDDQRSARQVANGVSPAWQAFQCDVAAAPETWRNRISWKPGRTLAR